MKVLQTIIDKEGNKFELFDEVWMHIRRYHPEIKNTYMLELILKQPDFIIKSSWDDQSYFYYKEFENRAHLTS